MQPNPTLLINAPKRPQPEAKKRLVMITGDKGGTGKSTFARGLLDTYQYRHIDCRAYDSDRRNAQLYRHYHQTTSGVTTIDIATQGAADEILDNLERNPSHTALIDMPAGSGEWFEILDRDINLIQMAANWNCRLTLVSVMSSVKDSINALRILMNYCGDRVDYVAVKNQHYGDDSHFAAFNASKTRAQFLELNGAEIIMPKLFSVSYNLVDQHDLSFRDAMTTGSPLTLSHRSRINQWLNTIEQEVGKAGKHLGVDG